MRKFDKCNWNGISHGVIKDIEYDSNKAVFCKLYCAKGEQSHPFTFVPPTAHHTEGKNEREREYTYGIECTGKKTIKTMLMRKLSGMQYWRLDFPLSLCGAPGQLSEFAPAEFSSGFAQASWRGREVILSLRGLWAKAHQRGWVTQQTGKLLPGIFRGWLPKNHFSLDSSWTLNDTRNLKRFVLFHLLILHLGI